MGTLASQITDDCLLNRLLRHRSMKTSKIRITGLCEGNPPVTGGFPSQRASNAENVSIWWRHHAMVEIGVVRDIGSLTRRMCALVFWVFLSSGFNTSNTSSVWSWDPIMSIIWTLVFSPNVFNFTLGMLGLSLNLSGFPCVFLVEAFTKLSPFRDLTLFLPRHWL